MKTLFREAPVTIGLCAAVIIIYLLQGPVLPSRVAPDSLLQTLYDVLRHGNVSHLLVNVVVLFLGGRVTEQHIGHIGTLLLVLACAVMGSLVQLAVVGGQFVGISGPAYGLGVFACFCTMAREKWRFIWLIIVVLLGLEIIFKADVIALYPHIISTILGGGLAMIGELFGKLFNKDTSLLMAMKAADIPRVVAVIAETDEDDAEEAEESLTGGSLEGMFVVIDGGELIGVTGYNLDDQVSDIAWLSWTYLTESRMGEGLGGKMLNELLVKLNKKGTRKIFIATSDYEEDGEAIYAGAHKMYQEFGATVELTVPGYHSPTEAKIVYGLSNPSHENSQPAQPAEGLGLRILGFELDDETDDVVAIDWEEIPEGIEGLRDTLSELQKDSARMAILKLPSDISDQNEEELERSGFTICGKLCDYYATELHQVWWTMQKS